MIRIRLTAAFWAALVTLQLFCGIASAQDNSKATRAKNATSTLPAATSSAPQAAPTPANGSLFTETAMNADLVVDFKPHRVGDLVFIRVDEASTATVSSSANRARDSGTIGGLVNMLAAIPSPTIAATSNVVGALGQRKFEGKGSTERMSALTGRIAARVVEVLPNGDLRIEAVKLVRINKEDDKFTLSGIVRQRDVSADNVVATSSVGDLRIAMNGKGVASADNAPGWLFKLLDKISPF